MVCRTSYHHRPCTENPLCALCVLGGLSKKTIKIHSRVRKGRREVNPGSETTRIHYVYDGETSQNTSVTVGTGGNYQVRNRYYSATLATFISRDPIGYKGGINLYEYVGDSPLMRSDASGTGGSHGQGSSACNRDARLKCPTGPVDLIIWEAEKRRGTKSPGDDSAHHCWAVCTAARRSLQIGGLPAGIGACV